MELHVWNQNVCVYYVTWPVEQVWMTMMLISFAGIISAAISVVLSGSCNSQNMMSRSVHEIQNGVQEILNVCGLASPLLS